MRQSTQSSFNRGISLVEVIVSLAILCGGVVALMGVFGSLAKSITLNRTRTLATTLGQEQIEAVKSMSYYRLRATSTTVVVPGLTPPVYSDEVNYNEPEVTVGPTVFHRYTTVDKVKKNPATGSLEAVPWSDPDTGLKRIQVTVVWRDGGTVKQFVLSNLYENPFRSAATSGFSGIVSSTMSIPLTNAKVEIIENPSWRAVTDGLGHYTLGAQPATYSLRASAPGYFSAVKWNVLLTGAPLVVPFQLSRKSSVTVMGTVWMNDHPVISQVVGSINRGVNYSSGDEYVEIYNPTTWTWTTLTGTRRMGLKFQRRISKDPDPREIEITYRNTVIPPSCFYLFANTGTVTVGAYNRTADAVWTSTSSHNQTEFSTARNPGATFTALNPNVIPVYEDHAGGGREGDGSLTLFTFDSVIGETRLDTVGWKGGGGGGHYPGQVEGTPIDQNKGLEIDEQFCRFTSTEAVVDGVRAPAMDSDDNDKDWDVFGSIGIDRRPKNSALSDAIPPKAGTPVVGANIFANDGLSTPVLSTLFINSGDHPAMARFTLGSVATGTWSVSGSSASAFGSVGVNTSVGLTATLFLTTSTSGGFVSGHVTSDTGADLMGIRVSAPLDNKIANAGGMYFLRVEPGLWPITANLGTEDPAYVESRKLVTVTKGQLTSGVDFILFGGIRLRGRITIDGANPLPDVPVKVVAASGVEYNPVNSLADGYFEISVPTGTYTVSPLPESTEAVLPPFSTVGSSVGGDTVWSSTFTVSSAYGTLSGRAMTGGGEPITSGVLIFVTTNTLPGSPPLPPHIDGSLRASGLSCYMASTRSDGTYELRAKGGLPFVNYNVYGWYTPTAGASTTTVRQTSVSLAPGGHVTCSDLTW